MYIIQEKYETAHPRRLKTSKLKTDFISAPISDFGAQVYGARDLGTPCRHNKLLTFHTQFS